MPKSIWLKILSGVYHCDLKPIGSGVSVTKRKVLSRIMGGRHLVSWTKLFFHVPEMYKNYPLFLTETSEQHKGRLLAAVTFYLFLSTRFVSDCEFSRNYYN